MWGEKRAKWLSVKCTSLQESSFLSGLDIAQVSLDLKRTILEAEEQQAQRETGQVTTLKSQAVLDFHDCCYMTACTVPLCS